MESVYFIKGRKLFGGVCGSSLNQTPFQMSHLIQGEIESGPRSSLVFKQPTIYILSTPSIERWMMETNVQRTMSHLDANILILLRKWKYSFLKFQMPKKSKIIFRLVYFLTQYQLLAILLLQKFRCEILNKLPNLDTTCRAKNTPPSTADERSAMFEIFFFFREGIVDSGARQRGK